MTEPTVTTPRRYLPMVLWTMLAFPLAVLSHEAAHFAGYLVFKFPEPRLRYDSTRFAGNSEFWKLARAKDWESAARIVQPHHAGIASAAGIVSSIAVMGLCIGLMKFRPHPFVLGLGFIATLRFLGSVFLLLTGRLGRNGSDEDVAAIFPIPELALHILGVAAMAATWYLLFAAIPREGRKRTIVGLLAGTFAGGVVYILIVGPLLLP